MEFKRILVPINGTRVDDEVIQLACQLAKRARYIKGFDKGEVYHQQIAQQVFHELKK